MTKRQIVKALKYAGAVALVIPAISGIFWMLAFAPAPVAFGAILGLLTFPFFLYIFR